MASQEYVRRVENLIHTLESCLTSTDLAEARDFVARGTPWQGLYSLAWIIERRGLSVPHEAKKTIARLMDGFVDRERLPESFRVFLPVCRRCGARIITVFREDDGLTPEYCYLCDPDRPRVKLSDLDRLPSVPSAYRKLVELELLVYHVIISPCGDVEFLVGDNLFAARNAFAVIEQNPHLQPFAQMGTGDLWCWTAFRTGSTHEPETVLIEDSMERVVVYAPNFQTFLYRNALDEASEWYETRPDLDKRLPNILDRAKVLRKLGEDVLADDLESVVGLPLKDCTPDYLRSRGEKCLTRLAKEDVEDRVERFRGNAFVRQEHGYDFLRSA